MGGTECANNPLALEGMAEFEDGSFPSERLEVLARLGAAVAVEGRALGSCSMRPNCVVVRLVSLELLAAS